MFLKRTIIGEIEKWINKKEIIILIGARQVGKTTLLKYFFDKVHIQKYWFDLDKFKDCTIFSNFEKLINFLKLQGFDFNKKIFLFVDEFQYCKNSVNILKNLYDTYDNIKIFVSGSSSLNIKNLVQESLAGRKKIFKIYPLSLEEIINWKFGNFDIKIFENISSIKDIGDKYLNLLYRYMIFGSYPKIILDNNFAYEHLENIFDLYLKKDIIDLLNIKHLDSFKKLIIYLAINNGTQINYSQIANFTDIDIGTVKNYIDILEETFLIKKVLPYFTNKNKEISKAPKIYFIDNGVRNFFIKNFIEDIDLRGDNGVLFEGIILQEFLKNKKENIKYWRTKTSQEVDFIVDNIINFDAIEIKFKEKISLKDYSGLIKIKNNYPKLINNCYLLSKYGGKKEIDNIQNLNIFTFISQYLKK